MGYERLMQVCPSCTNRWMADLFEEMGSPEKAEEIRSEGCGWVWNVWVEGENGEPEPRQVCGRQHLREAVNKLGSEVMLASETIQADRNEQKKAVDIITTAIRESGGNEAMQRLVELGMRAAIGSHCARAALPSTESPPGQPGESRVPPGPDDPGRDG